MKRLCVGCQTHFDVPERERGRPRVCCTDRCRNKSYRRRARERLKFLREKWGVGWTTNSE